MTAEIHSIKKDSTRAVLEKMLKWHDEGKISTVIMVGFGKDPETERAILAPVASDNITLSDTCIASQLFGAYADMALKHMLGHGVRAD
jgi:hypothetical protein